MLDVLKNLFEKDPAHTDAEPDDRELSIAATALMVELARIDESEDEVELTTIIDCAVRSGGLSHDEAQAILRDARHNATDATSLYEFTDRLNRHLEQGQKQRILVDIWRVAFADGRIDQYEEHLIRRIAELLHLNHREYMEARHHAEQSVSS